MAPADRIKEARRRNQARRAQFEISGKTVTKKWCTGGCGLDKGLDEYGIDHKGYFGRRSHCKVCYNKRKKDMKRGRGNEAEAKDEAEEGLGEEKKEEEREDGEEGKGQRDILLMAPADRIKEARRRNRARRA
jgi:hypothetical protein